MDKYEYGVSYDMTVDGNVVTDVMSVTTEGDANVVREFFSTDDRVSNVKIVKRPVGDWKDA
jgi:hypothetical protein